jgi:tetratricopeptide (TPR) repeat protein
MLEFTSSSPLEEVVLDPDGALPLLQEPMSGLDVARAVADLPWVGAGESAREVYEQAREGGLDDPDQWFKLGMTLYDGRYYTEALAAFERVADSEDRLWGLLGLVWQGHVLDLLDRREEALARYAEAQKLPWPGPIQHDQYGMVLGPDWLEARLETPFERVDAK